MVGADRQGETGSRSRENTLHFDWRPEEEGSSAGFGLRQTRSTSKAPPINIAFGIGQAGGWKSLTLSLHTLPLHLQRFQTSTSGLLAQYFAILGRGKKLF